METNKMKKIILALAVLAAVVCPVFAGESWIGVTTGPAFEMQVSDSLKDAHGKSSFATDFNWDVNVEGAYYFNEAETMGIGAKLGFGFNYGTTFEYDIPAGVTEEQFSQISGISNLDENPAAGTRIAPAVTFQYRLGLTDALDLRMGAGLQYVYTVGNEVMTDLSSMIPGFGTVMAQKMSYHNLEVIASTDIVYSIGSFQIFGGVDLGVSVMNYTVTKSLDPDALPTVKYTTDGEFITDGFQMSITPRIGVSYAF